MMILLDRVITEEYHPQEEGIAARIRTTIHIKDQ
jgi:hypothetical protein